MKLSAPRVLLGAGRQAGHLLNLMEWMGLPWQEVVLFDDSFPMRTSGPRERPIHGSLAEGVAYCREQGLPTMIALGSRTAALRFALYRQLCSAGAQLVNLIHPSAQVAPSVVMGVNVGILPGCVLSPGVQLGALSFLFAGVILEHDTLVGENVVCGPGVTTSGYVSIGAHAFLGTRSVCAPEVHIGARALIGAGAVVLRDIPDGMIAHGVPARVQHPAPAGSDVPTLEELNALGVAI